MENDGRIKAPEAEARDSFVDGQRGSMPVAAQPVDQKRVDLYDPDSMKTAVGQQISSRIPTPPLSPVADDLPPAVRADYTALLNQASIDTTVSRARLKNLSNTPTSLGPAKTPVEKLSQGMVADTMTGPASTEDHPQSFPPSVAASKTSSALRAQRPVAVATP